MGAARTTRCCRVVALILASSLVVSAQTRKGATLGVPLFPIRNVWTLALNRPLSTPPSYAGAHAYFSLEGGPLVAYELTSGRQEWQTAIRPRFQTTAGEGLIFVVEADQLTALHAADGTVAWHFPLTTELAVTPVWDNGWLVLVTREGELLALRGKDGQLLWHRPLNAHARTAPSLAADRVYVAVDDGRVIALRVENGEPVWERRLGGPATGLLAQDDRIFAGSTDNYFYSIDSTSGLVDWRWRTGADLVGAPLVDEQNVYFVSLDNVLRALSRKTGGQQWMRLLPLRPNRGPIRAGTSIVVTGVAPTLRAYNVTDGKPAGELATNGELDGATYTLPGSPLPSLLIVTRDLSKGATATLVAHQAEPPISPLGTLPNPITLAGRPATTGPASTTTPSSPSPATPTARPAAPTPAPTASPSGPSR